MRGAFNQSRGGTQEAQAPLPPPINEELHEDKAPENSETSLPKHQQPATKIPVESPPIRQDESPKIEEAANIKVQNETEQAPLQHTEEVSKIEDTDEINSDKMPKTSHRRGQPPPGNHNAPPPMANRGRGTRGHRPSPRHTPSAPQFQPQQESTQKVEIVDEEVVHNDEPKSGMMEPPRQTLPPQQTPPPPKKQEEPPKEVVKEEMLQVEPQHDNQSPRIGYELEETNNFEESQNKKKKAKEMFGKMFENDSSDSGNQSRGRSPNFSDRRNDSSDKEDNFRPYKPQTKAPKQSQGLRKVKHSRNNDLNKSVDIFGTTDNRFETEPLIQDENNALNTSFGYDEDKSKNLMGDEITSTEKILASSDLDNSANRSKTPPIPQIRDKISSDQDKDRKFHQPIGAKEDFIIEEPVVEPSHAQAAVKSSPSNPPSHSKSKSDTTNAQTSPQVPDKPKEEPQRMQLDKNLLQEPRPQDAPKPPVTTKNTNKKPLLPTQIEETKNIYTEASNIVPKPQNTKQSVPSNLNKSLTNNDFSSIPISHTSSVKSLPDEVERLSENLKQKKQECEELKLKAIQVENELRIQVQVNQKLKEENDRLRNSQRSPAPADHSNKLDIENKKLWDIINQMKEEQQELRSIILSSFSSPISHVRQAEVDQSHEQAAEEDKIDADYNKIVSVKNDQDIVKDILKPSTKVTHNRHLDVMTQEMMNNAAGSGSNQEDFMIQEKNNDDDGEGDDDEYDDDYNEEGTSGGNAKHSNRGDDYRRYRDEQYEHAIDNEGRIIQGNERRGRQKQNKKKRGVNKNVRGNDRDSGDEYEEEKIPVIASSGVQPHSYKKGKQSQPYGRQSEHSSSNQFAPYKQEHVYQTESYSHHNLVSNTQRQRPDQRPSYNSESTATMYNRK